MKTRGIKKLTIYSVFVICLLIVKGYSSEEFWKKVESFDKHINEEAPVIMQDRILFCNPKEGRRQMALASTGRSSMINSYFSKNPIPKSVLDLGCGVGANSILFLKKNATVVAIDNCQEVLNKFKASLKDDTDSLNNLTLICNDITTCEYSKKSGEYDVVLCIDILSYIKPSTLRSTLEKIHYSLHPNGKLFGTLFFSSPCNNKTLHFHIELIEKLGGCVYPGNRFCP